MKNFEELIANCQETSDARTQAFVELKKNAPAKIKTACEAAKKLGQTFPLFHFQVGRGHESYNPIVCCDDVQEFEFLLSSTGKIFIVDYDFETSIGLENHYEEGIDVQEFNFSGKGLLTLMKQLPMLLEVMRVKAEQETMEVKSLIQAER